LEAEPTGAVSGMASTWTTWLLRPSIIGSIRKEKSCGGVVEDIGQSSGRGRKRDCNGWPEPTHVLVVLSGHSRRNLDLARFLGLLAGGEAVRVEDTGCLDLKLDRAIEPKHEVDAVLVLFDGRVVRQWWCEA
jgi:hypothetical protein